MLNNEAKLLNEALCEICPQRQAFLMVAHDLAGMLSLQEGLSVRRRQIIAAATILHITHGQIGIEMVRILEKSSYVPSYRRAILELVYSLEETDASKDALIIHNALLLSECMLCPEQTKMLEKMILSSNAKRILEKYEYAE